MAPVLAGRTRLVDLRAECEQGYSVYRADESALPVNGR
jgi:hypothetical protein